MTGGTARSSDVNPCAITQMRCRSVPSSTHPINNGYRSVDFHSALGCHEHGKYLLPVRDTRKASIPRSVVVASTQMSLRSFALQSDTYKQQLQPQLTKEDLIMKRVRLKGFPLPDQPSPGKHIYKKSAFHQQVH